MKTKPINKLFPRRWLLVQFLWLWDGSILASYKAMKAECFQAVLTGQYSNPLCTCVGSNTNPLIKSSKMIVRFSFYLVPFICHISLHLRFFITVIPTWKESSFSLHAFKNAIRGIPLAFISWRYQPPIEKMSTKKKKRQKCELCGFLTELYSRQNLPVILTMPIWFFWPGNRILLFNSLPLIVLRTKQSVKAHMWGRTQS